MAIELQQGMKTSMHQSYISFLVHLTQTWTSSKIAVLENVTNVCVCFFLIVVDSDSDATPLKKQELWKTASLDRNPHLNQAQVVKRWEGCSAFAWYFLPDSASN